MPPEGRRCRVRPGTPATHGAVAPAACGSDTGNFCSARTATVSLPFAFNKGHEPKVGSGHRWQAGICGRISYDVPGHDSSVVKRVTRSAASDSVC